MAAIPADMQTLLVAFALGILCQAGLATLHLYFKGYGYRQKLWEDRQRLVLILFLVAVFIWAQMSFGSLFVPPTSVIACQATVITSTLFDQAARVILASHLLWIAILPGKSLRGKCVVGILLGIRTVAGAIFIGFTRPQFEPVCTPRSQLLPASIAVIIIDIIIVGVLVVRTLTLETVKQSRDKTLGSVQRQCQGLISAILGFLLWSLTSLALLLGLPTTMVFLMVGLPAVGLTILVFILAAFSDVLSLQCTITKPTPESQSPYINQGQVAKVVSAFDGRRPGVPTTENTTRHKKLFVANQSNTSNKRPALMLRRGSKVANLNLTKHTISAHEEDEDKLPRNLDSRKEIQRRSSGIFGAIMDAPLAITNTHGKAHFSVGQTASFYAATTPRSAAWYNFNGPKTKPESFQSNNQGLFYRLREPTKVSIRGLGISGPMVARENSDGKPFARMETIDLAQAAANERARREVRKPLVASRSAPPPPSMRPAESLQKITKIERKKTMENAQLPKSLAPDSSYLSVNLTGSSSSALLSPLNDNLRRRSPSSMAFNGGAQQTDLKRNNTLPSNPRGGLPSHARFQQSYMAPQPQLSSTIMQSHDIPFDDAGTVKSIIQDAAMFVKNKQKRHVSEVSHKSTASIIHRPRPNTRAKDADRPIFPCEPSPRKNHERGKSGSSYNSKKSILFAVPAGGDQLPPLPPPPTSAKSLARIFPNDTRSMTVEEKISYLFPATPGGRQIGSRRSSVPSIPCLPSSFNFELSKAETEQENKRKRASKRSTIDFEAHYTASTSAPSIQACTPVTNIKDATHMSSGKYTANPNRRYSSHTETSTSASVSQGGTSIWASLHSPANAVDLIKEKQVAKATYVQMRKEQSQKPDLSRELPKLPESDETTYDDETADVSIMLDTHERSHFSATTVYTNHYSIAASSVAVTATVPDSLPDHQKILPTWHKRIGDQLPTFSKRTNFQHKSRRAVPPPLPLLLGSTARKSVRLNQVAPPSPEEIDSPTRAYEEIQTQLRRLEMIDTDLVLDMATLLDEQACIPEFVSKRDSRIDLLQDLEAEMGAQRDHWRKMQQNLSRDSNGTLGSLPPNPNCDKPLPEININGSNGGLSEALFEHDLRSQDRIPSGALNNYNLPVSLFSMYDPSASENSRASIWQQRLAQAQEFYLETTSNISGERPSVSCLAYNNMLVSSPTPPISLNSGSEDGDEYNSGYGGDEDIKVHFEMISPISREFESLWQHKLPNVQSRTDITEKLWVAPADIVHTASCSEPIASCTRPARRRNLLPLKIFSTHLWAKPVETAARVAKELWNSGKSRPRSIATRPKTIRPQRRPRRFTLLADIVESPKPLPYNHDTLGILQYPWGEMSDRAIYVPTQITIPFLPSNNYSRSTHSVNYNNNSGDLNYQDYSSSFFDDYETEHDSDIDYDDDDDDSLDFESSDDDSSDSFNENTLLDIASLLGSKTEDLPSRESMFKTQEILETIEDCELTDVEDNGSDVGIKREMIRVMPIQPLVMSRPISQERQRAVQTLWQKERPVEESNLGLAQPQPHIWQAYLPEPPTQALRTSKSMLRGESDLQPQHLWNSSTQYHIKPVTKILWTPSKTPPLARVWLWCQPLHSKTSSSDMWLAANLSPKSDHALWTSDRSKASEFAKDLSQVTPHSISSRPPRKRSVDVPLPKLLSDSFWTPKDNVTEKMELNWLYTSIVPEVVEESEYLLPLTYKPPAQPQEESSTFHRSEDLIDESEVDRLGEELMGKELWRYNKETDSDSVRRVVEEWKMGKRNVGFVSK